MTQKDVYLVGKFHVFIANKCITRWGNTVVHFKPCLDFKLYYRSTFVNICNKSIFLNIFVVECVVLLKKYFV